MRILFFNKDSNWYSWIHMRFIWDSSVCIHNDYMIQVLENDNAVIQFTLLHL